MYNRGDYHLPCLPKSPKPPVRYLDMYYGILIMYYGIIRGICVLGILLYVPLYDFLFNFLCWVGEL